MKQLSGTLARVGQAPFVTQRELQHNSGHPMVSRNSDTSRTSTGRARTVTYTARPDGPDEPRTRRDPKKLFLVVGLALLSWVATYVGMLELIEANMGELPLLHKVIIGFSVGMLMTMVVWLLDQMFAPIGFFYKLIYTAGYVFLTLISIGFGFGFYWKVLESKSEGTRGAESAITQVQGSLYAASTRLEQLQSTLIQLTAVSTQKAEIERTQGTSCPNSKPGDGPRRKLRDEDAQRFTFASDYVKPRVAQIKTDMAALDVDLARIVKDDKSIIDAKSGTRNDFMRSVSRKLDLTVTGFNAFRTDPQLKQMRADLAERAEKTTFLDTRGGSYACPDPQLQTALRGVVRAIDSLPDVQKPQVTAVEGSEATVEAFRRLTATFIGALSFKLPPSAEELRDLQKKAVQSVESSAPQVRPLLLEQAGLSKRDYIPLSIAVFVDLCLLLVSMGRPINRMNGLVPKMRAAEAGPVSEILSRFNDIHKDPRIRETFEIFRHVVFDFNGDYYAAVPLDAPKVKKSMVPVRDKQGNIRPVERTVALASDERSDMQADAHQLANLFTSFEKERIFTRVMMPILSTGAIQKKLARQGSKFADSEAFRIYKFKDGAWQEMILGAIMGAAKRVERENTEIAHERAHELAMPPQRPIGPPPAPPQPSLDTRRPLPDEITDKRTLVSTVYGDNVTPLPRRMQTPGANTAAASMPRTAAPAAVYARTAAEPPAPPRDVADAPRTNETSRNPVQPATDQARRAAPAPLQGEIERRGDDRRSDTPARNDTPQSFTPQIERALRGDPATDIEQLGRIRDAGEPKSEPLRPVTQAEPTVEVEARRESVTYRMPLSEAPLAVQRQAAVSQAKSEAAPQVVVVPQIASSSAPATSEIAAPMGTAPVGDDIDFRKIAGKFGHNTGRA